MQIVWMTTTFHGFGNQFVLPAIDAVSDVLILPFDAREIRLVINEGWLELEDDARA